MLQPNEIPTSILDLKHVLIERLVTQSRPIEMTAPRYQSPY